MRRRKLLVALAGLAVVIAAGVAVLWLRANRITPWGVVPPAPDLYIAVARPAQEQQEIESTQEGSRKAPMLPPGGDVPVTRSRLSRACMQGAKHAWFLKGPHFLLVADNGEVPASLLRALLGPDRMASRIRGRWDLDTDKGQLVLTNLDADGKPGLKEVRLSISPAGAVRVNLENSGQYNLISFAEKPHVPARGETYPIYDFAQRIDHEFLQGTWVPDIRDVDRKAAAPDSTRGNSIVLKGNNWTVVSQGKTSKGTFRLDAVPTPGTLDVTFTEGSEKGNTYLGIYELQGDNLKLCRVPAGKDRPTAFVRKSGNEVLETYRRAAGGSVDH